MLTITIINISHKHLVNLVIHYFNIVQKTMHQFYISVVIFVINTNDCLFSSLLTNQR